jgi:hypothetical protein
MTLALVGMVSMLGAVSMVIDAGVYFVLQRQLQNAADAAALSAVWYDPACVSANWGDYGCQSVNAPSAQECSQAPNNAYDARPCTAAVDTMKANWSQALALCAGPNLPNGTIPVNISTHPGLPPNQSLIVPSVTPYVVTLSCDAPHWFARVLPGVKLTMTINASAAAALGWLGPNGQLVGDPRPANNPPLVARLIL